VNRILVFCSDVLPLKGMATSGGGLRSWQIVQGLAAHGLEVVYSMPETCYLSRTFREHIPQEARENLWTSRNQDEVIQKVKPDVIILTKPALKSWHKKYDIPLVIDFHGPDLIEAEQMFKGFEPSIRVQRSIAKLRTVAEADFFTCAGNRQRHYFMAFLILAGVALEDLDIHVMPVAMSGELPQHRTDLEDRFIIFAGGFYPWLNPMPALLDLADCLGRLGGLTLQIFGGIHGTNPEEKRVFDLFKEKMERNPHVTFHGTVSRDELMTWYQRACAAFEIMPWNAERELAFTTRTVEFLWAGLPVIYNDYAELSELIGQYEAGWLVPPGNVPALEKVVKLVAEDSAALQRASENAQRLVREKLTYDKVIGPLATFCQHPRRRERAQDGNFFLVHTGKSDWSRLDSLYLDYRTLAWSEFVTKFLRDAMRYSKYKVFGAV